MSVKKTGRKVHRKVLTPYLRESTKFKDVEGEDGVQKRRRPVSLKRRKFSGTSNVTRVDLLDPIKRVTYQILHLT